MNNISFKVYLVIAIMFLSIFYPPSQYQKVGIKISMPIKEEENVYSEQFFANFKILTTEGYLKVTKYSFIKKKEDMNQDNIKDTEQAIDTNTIELLKKLRKSDTLQCNELLIKEGKTSPPKRYNSGSLILAMESAGQLIEDEELRAQIKGSGIGTSATRAEILKKLVNIKYLALNKKTQIITPTQMGEMVYEVVNASIYHLLNPELTASWEKGLTYVAEGKITSDEYMNKLEGFVTRRTMGVINYNKQYELKQKFNEVSKFYKK